MSVNTDTLSDRVRYTITALDLPRVRLAVFTTCVVSVVYGLVCPDVPIDIYRRRGVVSIWMGGVYHGGNEAARPLLLGGRLTSWRHRRSRRDRGVLTVRLEQAVYEESETNDD